MAVWGAQTRTAIRSVGNVASDNAGANVLARQGT